ncbi:transcription termination/antitermination protein NusG-like [Dioscorea cayenensis subsp. rotundata]|uniref:Transcription termination/antitermination protein NusG-like n=1 Tax=Dioscorea cayennensis subsp. rotundata TaxID=55577 RepID=A0AB40CWZ5_DIOCR|nr:transcription termination/antitermination protein NusG-like [Dioscorea cayenensis subsp. rotundata]
MLQVLQWRPSLLPSPRASISFRTATRCISVASLPLETSAGSGGAELTARERRKLRNERRDRSSNWREDVEERLIKKPKKGKSSTSEGLNLDKLSLLGPQWWIVRVARTNAHETAERISRALVRNFPGVAFKVYYPTVREQRVLKNGSCTTKLKPICPGCIFLHCVLNKEIHDCIRECDAVGGFLGFQVGNNKRKINRPKPVGINDMEAIFQQVREEQENADQAFVELQKAHNKGPAIDSREDLNSPSSKVSRNSRKGVKSIDLLVDDSNRLLTTGASIRVLSGPFAEFTGYLKKLNRKNGKATVGFMLFGKESTLEVEIDQIVVETS